MTFGTKGPDFPAGCAVIFGANGGIGQAIAGLIAERGAAVVIVYRSDPGKAKALADRIAQEGGKATTAVCDVTDRAAVEKVMADALAAHGRIHTVVSAIGPLIEVTPLSTSREAHFRSVIDADVHGFYNIAQLAVQYFKKGGGGSLTALVSPVIDRVVPNDSMSAIPKAALAMMVKHIAREEADSGIRANVVGPGVTNAGLVTGALAAGPARDMLDFAQSLAALKRRAEASEIAEVVAFIASAKASYVTGQTIMVDGGLSL